MSKNERKEAIAVWTLLILAELYLIASTVNAMDIKNAHILGYPVIALFGLFILSVANLVKAIRNER